MQWYVWIVLSILLLGSLFAAIHLIHHSNKKRVKMTTRELMYVVTFSTLAIVVGFFEIPIGPTGLKFDFSEVVVLITFILLGWRGTSFVIILRSFVRFFLPAKTAAEGEIIIKLIGEVIAILASYLIILSYVITKKLFRKKEKPLLVAVPTNIKKVNFHFHLVNSIISIIILTGVITLFHILFTMPIYTSFLWPQGDKKHYFITSFLKDNDYNETFKSVLLFVITSFGLLNVMKALITSILFLIFKPKIELMIINL